MVLQVRDPVALQAGLERHGLVGRRTVDGFEIVLVDDRLSIRAGATDRPITIAPCPPAAPPADGRRDGRLMAVGFATVDHERFAREHGLGTLEDGPDDDLLGASSWRSADLERLILLQPATEGRLAAALARAGEGPLVVYLSTGDAVRPVNGSPTALGVPGVLVRLPDRLPSVAIIVV